MKWIKIVSDIFDDEKILLIESMPSADSILVIWFKLLCLAGKTSNSGVFIFNDSIPYTDEMLSTIFRRDINTVRLALNTFEGFGMIEIVNGVVTIPNWEKHQTLDSYERRKERDRIAKQQRRKQQKMLLSADMSADASADVSPLEIEVEREVEIDKERDGTSSKAVTQQKRDETADEPPTIPSVPYERIKVLYNSICLSFPRCTALSDARKKAIKARFVSGYSIDDFERLFSMAEASSFLKGRNNRNWTASFDWLIKDANMAKVLDGNYGDKPQQQNAVVDDLDFIPN